MNYEQLFSSSSQDGLFLLDGATGTELEHRGFNLGKSGWSARAILEAPELLYKIHADYVEAGAQIITANTFRTHASNVSAWTTEISPQVLTHNAVQIARKATGNRALVAGSIAPISDCYAPEQTLPRHILELGHKEHVGNLRFAGVDLLLIETMPTRCEAEVALQQAAGTGLPVWLGIQVGSNGDMLCGASIMELAVALNHYKPHAVLLNCVPAVLVEHYLARLIELCNSLSYKPMSGVYANTGMRNHAGLWEQTDAKCPQYYGDLARGWLEHGITIIGGCCGTTREHIKVLARLQN